GLAVAVPDHHCGAVGGALTRGVQALGAVHHELPARGVGPPLVGGAADAVPELGLRPVGGAGVADLGAAPGLDADELDILRVGVAAALHAGRVDHRLRAGRPTAVRDRDVAVDDVAAVAVGHVRAAVGRPVVGDREVAHVLGVVVVGGGPGAGGGEHVVAGGVVARALVEVEPEPAVGPQAVVLVDGPALVRRQRVDAPAVGHLL